MSLVMPEPEESILRNRSELIERLQVGRAGPRTGRLRVRC